MSALMIWLALMAELALILPVDMLLYQQYNNQTACLPEAMFICKDYNSFRLIEWTVVSEDWETRNLVFPPLDGIGSVRTTVIESTSITAILLYINSTFYVTSLTISTHHNVTIRCNSDMTSYTPYQNFIPEIHMQVITLESTTNFELFWSSFCATMNYSYIVTISSDHLLENLIYFTNSTSIFIHLNVNSWLYNITISSHRTDNTFTFACPLLSDPSVSKYVVRQNGSMTAIRNGTANNMECINSKWEGIFHIPDLYSYFGIITTTSDSTPPLVTHSIINPGVYILILILVGATLLVLISAVVILAIMRKRKLSKTNVNNGAPNQLFETEADYSSLQHMPSNVPPSRDDTNNTSDYEIVQNLHKLKLEKNIAYSTVKLCSSSTSNVKLSEINQENVQVKENIAYTTVMQRSPAHCYDTIPDRFCQEDTRNTSPIDTENVDLSNANGEG